MIFCSHLLHLQICYHETRVPFVVLVNPACLAVLFDYLFVAVMTDGRKCGVISNMVATMASSGYIPGFGYICFRTVCQVGLSCFVYSLQLEEEFLKIILLLEYTPAYYAG